MPGINEHQIRGYVEAHIQEFHERRLDSLQNLSLTTVLKRKNPYLFKAKNTLTAEQFVRGVLEAHLSSQEEGIFGTFLEGLAIFICRKVYHGRKSAADGIDLEFEKDDGTHIVTIKSGPNWGNSRQIAKMKSDFRKAKTILRTNRSRVNIIAVNGCCYGRDERPDKGDYFKYCGQRFWAFISGNENLYIDIIKPLGHQAKERNDSFTAEYAKAINRFTHEFMDRFCDADGTIRWPDVVKFNSGNKEEA